MPTTTKKHPKRSGKARSSVARGSILAIAAENLASYWETLAAYQRRIGAANAAGWIDACAKDIRREMARANQRQPESNS